MSPTISQTEKPTDKSLGGLLWAWVRRPNQPMPPMLKTYLTIVKRAKAHSLRVSPTEQQLLDEHLRRTGAYPQPT